MRLRILTTFSMTLGILAATIGFAGPAPAATEWTMPDVRNMVLSKAVKSVEEATDSAELDLKFIDNRNVQEIINQTNWSVCYQYPAAGNAISQKTKKVLLYVKRFNQQSCWS